MRAASKGGLGAMAVMDKEITGRVALCDASGALNTAAAGWGRHPHWDCNLRGRFPRKKRWDYWCFVGPERLFSVCLANIDFLGLGAAYLLEYATGRYGECAVALPFSRQPMMPNGTLGDAAIQFGRTRFAQHLGADGGAITAASPRCGEMPLDAEIHVKIPAAQETLNVVVPWCTRSFQFTSKQLPLSIEGEVRWGDEIWRFTPETSFGVRDFGRGIWPYRTTWNWAALSARDASGRTCSVNLGAQWTDGTGATENGLLIDGVLYPIAATVKIEYDRRDFMKPWRLYTPGSPEVDLHFTPFYDRKSNLNLGFLKAAGHQCFGRFSGAVRTGGQVAEFSGALGWAEEHIARW